MKKILLTTKEELNIYMSPVRQQLLRMLSITGAPMTPKMLADKLQISASGAQHHIKKLISLGLIELDHTESINGITASFYKPAQVTVQIGLSRNDGLSRQRDALMQNTIAKVYDSFHKQMMKRVESNRDKDPDSLKYWGDILSGIAYLDEIESKKMINLINEFLEQHAKPKINCSPWEYALIAYNAEDLDSEEWNTEEKSAGDLNNGKSYTGEKERTATKTKIF